jgi:hypothetical protein
MKCTNMTRKRLGLKRMAGLKKAGLLLAGMMAATMHAAITVSPEEMAQDNKWVQQHLLTAANLPPFPFTFCGQPSSRLLPSWARGKTETILDANRTQHVMTWTKGVLQVRCVAVEYSDYRPPFSAEGGDARREDGELFRPWRKKTDKKPTRNGLWLQQCGISYVVIQ